MVWGKSESWKGSEEKKWRKLVFLCLTKVAKKHQSHLRYHPKRTSQFRDSLKLFIKLSFTQKVNNVNTHKYLYNPPTQCELLIFPIQDRDVTGKKGNERISFLFGTTTLPTYFGKKLKEGNKKCLLFYLICINYFLQQGPLCGFLHSLPPSDYQTQGDIPLLCSIV